MDTQPAVAIIIMKVAQKAHFNQWQFEFNISFNLFYVYIYITLAMSQMH